MSKVVTIQSDFTAGEMSPRLLARVDLEAYRHGTETMINAYPLAHGGATRRHGTLFVGEVYDSTKPVKLIPFIYSKTISYMLVINGGRIQFIRDGNFIESSPGVRYHIACPYTDSELDELRYAQVGALMYFAQPNHPPKQLVATGDTSWTLSDVTFTYRAKSDYWYENYFLKFKILNGTVTFKKGDTFTFTKPGTTATPGGSNVGNGTVFGIEYFNSGPNELWTLTCTFADDNNQEWSVTGATSGTKIAQWHTNNYPGAVGIFEQRLYWAGTTSHPQTIWGSKIGEYTNLSVGSNDNDSVQFNIASSQYDQILHIMSSRYLIPLTFGSEFSMVGGTTTGITSSSVKITQQTSHGSNDVTPIRIGQEILFVQRGGRKVRAISYSVTEDVNVAPDISILGEHITRSGIRDATFAQDPDYIAWMVRNDGVLISLTHLRDFEQTGWARHTTDGKFIACASIPFNVYDDTYFCVERILPGSPSTTVRYIEVFDYTSVLNTDCALMGSVETATDLWTGLGHLEGKEVAIVADGQVHPNETVIDGKVTLQYPANVVEVGLPYNTTITLLHPDVPLNDGTSQGRSVSINEVVLRLQDTIGCTVNNEEIPFRRFGDELGEAVPPFTGDLMVNSLGWSTKSNNTIEQRLPMPFTLLGVVQKVTVND